MISKTLKRQLLIVPFLLMTAATASAIIWFDEIRFTGPQGPGVKGSMVRAAVTANEVIPVVDLPEVTIKPGCLYAHNEDPLPAGFANAPGSVVPTQASVLLPAVWSEGVFMAQVNLPVVEISASPYDHESPDEADQVRSLPWSLPIDASVLLVAVHRLLRIL